MAESWLCGKCWAENKAEHAVCWACELRDENARLMETVEKLPKLGDGVPAVPGMRVYCEDEGAESGVALDWIQDLGDDGKFRPRYKSRLDREQWPETTSFYSTSEAVMEAAEKNP